MNQTIVDPLAELTQRFVARTRDNAHRLRELSSGIIAPVSPAYDEMHRLVHRLAGTAGTFGYDHLSQVAAELDELMNAGCGDIELLRRHLATVLAEIDAMPACLPQVC